MVSWTQNLRLLAELGGGAIEKVPGQERYVGTALGQGEHVHADHVQAMEEVFPEAAIANPVFQILVGSGNDPHVHLDWRVAANPIELAVGQDPEQACLRVLRHVADLIEKQRATVGLLEAADPARVGAGKGAFLMAEELRLDKLPEGWLPCSERRRCPGRAGCVDAAPERPVPYLSLRRRE